MEYYSCRYIERAHLHFLHRVDVEKDNTVYFCCDGLISKPGVNLKADGKETINAFLELRENFIEESKQIGAAYSADERHYSKGCVECANFKLQEWPKQDGNIYFVNLGMFPAPCQCKCIYCNSKDDVDRMTYNKSNHSPYFEVIFDSIEYAQQARLISEDVKCQVASGEITIHPFKKRFYEIVKNRPTLLLTNGFVFDEDLAKLLAANSRAKLNLSIDSGTPTTWHRVKGVNNFDMVIKNLERYAGYAKHAGQITLKYIVLPGINDSEDDYAGVSKLMKGLKCAELSISRDLRDRHTIDDVRDDLLAKSTARLVAALHNNNLKGELHSIAFSSKMCEKIDAYKRLYY